MTCPYNGPPVRPVEFRGGFWTGAPIPPPPPPSTVVGSHAVRSSVDEHTGMVIRDPASLPVDRLRCAAAG